MRLTSRQSRNAAPKAAARRGQADGALHGVPRVTPAGRGIGVALFDERCMTAD
ncbi:MAG: hypothetical protein R3B07_25320 [Polyangiaceae bacterium]